MNDITKPRALPSGRECNKTVMTTLATYLRNDTKIIISHEVKTYVYKCPSLQCNFCNNEIVFPTSSSWCIGSWEFDFSYFWMIKDDFTLEESMDVMKKIELIVLKSLPVNIVEDPTYRRLHSFDKRHGSVKIKQVMFKLCEYIEKL